jgi:hypothetical protein
MRVRWLASEAVIRVDECQSAASRRLPASALAATQKGKL